MVFPHCLFLEDIDILARLMKIVIYPKCGSYYLLLLGIQKKFEVFQYMSVGAVLHLVVHFFLTGLHFYLGELRLERLPVCGVCYGA